MAIILSNSQRSVELPDLQWIDKYTWTNARDNKKYSLTGSLIIETSAVQAGRTITLKGGDDFGWLTEDQMRTLQQMMDDNENITLEIDGEIYTVRFNYPDPVSGRKILPSQYYNDVEIRFIEV